MQKIGIESAVLFVASLLSFLVAVYSPEWRTIGFVFCGLFFAAACVILAITIKKRTDTRIG